MVPQLTIIHDRPDFTVLHANIFTPSQGICCQRLEPSNGTQFDFNRNLAYGSWYEIQIIGKVTLADSDETKVQRFLKKGIFLSYGKSLNLSNLIAEQYLDFDGKWTCKQSECKKENIGSIAICEHCRTNCHEEWVSWVSYIPLIGTPFSIANAVLKTGKAGDTGTHKVEAGCAIASAAFDVATAPFIVGLTAKAGAKVLARSGAELTAKFVAKQAAKVVLKQAAVVTVTRGVSVGVVQTARTTDAARLLVRDTAAAARTVTAVAEDVGPIIQDLVAVAQNLAAARAFLRGTMDTLKQNHDWILRLVFLLLILCYMHFPLFYN